MKRGEVKQLRRDGFALTSFSIDKADEAMDRVFEMAFTADQVKAIDELPNCDAIKLWQGVLLETFGAPGEEKN